MIILRSSIVPNTAPSARSTTDIVPRSHCKQCHRSSRVDPDLPVIARTQHTACRHLYAGTYGNHTRSTSFNPTVSLGGTQTLQRSPASSPALHPSHCTSHRNGIYRSTCLCYTLLALKELSYATVPSTATPHSHVISRRDGAGTDFNTIEMLIPARNTTLHKVYCMHPVPRPY